MLRSWCSTVRWEVESHSAIVRFVRPFATTGRCFPVAASGIRPTPAPSTWREPSRSTEHASRLRRCRRSTLAYTVRCGRVRTSCPPTAGVRRRCGNTRPRSHRPRTTPGSGGGARATRRFPSTPPTSRTFREPAVRCRTHRTGSRDSTISARRSARRPCSHLGGDHPGTTTSRPCHMPVGNNHPVTGDDTLGSYRTTTTAIRNCRKP